MGGEEPSNQHHDRQPAARRHRNTGRGRSRPAHRLRQHQHRQGGASTPTTSPSTVTPGDIPAPVTSAPAPSSAPSVRLVWDKFPLSDGDPAAYYVARISNPADSPAAEVLNTYACLDATGTIVGSDRSVLPLIPAHTQFDSFGSIGGDVLGVTLTGTPASVKVQMVQVTGAGGGEPMLTTSELMLTKGGPDTFTNAPGTYDMLVKVTNSTPQTLTLGVTQQVVLYD